MSNPNRVVIEIWDDGAWRFVRAERPDEVMIIMHPIQHGYDVIYGEGHISIETLGVADRPGEVVFEKAAQCTAPRHQPESALLSQEALRERQAAQLPPPEDDAVGRSIKDLLQAYVTRPTFVQYISPCRFACNDGALVITAPDANKRNWLENRLGKTIKQALAGITDGPGEVRFDLR